MKPRVVVQAVIVPVVVDKYQFTVIDVDCPFCGQHTRTERDLLVRNTKANTWCSHYVGGEAVGDELAPVEYRVWFSPVRGKALDRDEIRGWHFDDLELVCPDGNPFVIIRQ